MPHYARLFSAEHVYRSLADFVVVELHEGHALCSHPIEFTLMVLDSSALSHGDRTLPTGLITQWRAMVAN